MNAHMQTTRKHIVRPRRRGIAVIYIACCIVVLFGFCSLAVDLGRVQVAKTELRRAADSAARAGVAVLSQGNSTAQSVAVSMAANNTCDGTSVTISTSNVVVGYWNSSTHKFSS